MSESTDKSNKIITFGDQATTEDELGFTPYVIAMAEFLTNENTKPPLTISIEGEWGSGKSSFMKQLEKEILKKSEELDKKDLAEVWQKIKEDQIIFSNLSDIGKFIRLGLKQKTQTVWFNAWRHEKSESLWATFALSFLEELSKNRNIPDFFYNLYSRFQLFIYRLNFKDKPFKAIQTLVMVSLISSITVAIPIVYWKFGFEGVYQLSENLADTLKSDSKEEDKSQKEEAETTNNETKENDNSDSESTNNEDTNNLSLNILLQLVGISSSAAGIGKLFGIIKDLIGDEKMDLTLYLESPDYEKEAAFIEEFHEDFSKIVGAYVGKEEKIYVFIDDLDRCELGKAADLLQGINMMISDDPNLIFILGMDREKVAASITFKQKDVIPFLASIAKENQAQEKGNDKLSKQIDYGFSFLEKFVQLSFYVPATSQNTLNNFVKKISENQTEIYTEIYQEKQFFGIPYSLIAETFNFAKQFEDAKFIFKELGKKVVKRFSRKEETEAVVQPQIIEEILKLEETEDSPPYLAIFPVIDKDLDVQKLAEVIEMVAPFFDYNPRRLKQYINVLRLRTYIAYYAIGVTSNEKPITIEQIAKFTALTLKYPRLLFELKNNQELLADLEKYAVDLSPQSNNAIRDESTANNQEKGNANYWIDNYSKIKQLLSSEIKQTTGSPNNEQKTDNKYVFQDGSIKKLLQVSPQGISPKYFKLRQLLAAGKWKEANDETFNLIFEAPNIEEVYRSNRNSLSMSSLKELNSRLEKVGLKPERVGLVARVIAGRKVSRLQEVVYWVAVVVVAGAVVVAVVVTGALVTGAVVLGEGVAVLIVLGAGVVVLGAGIVVLIVERAGVVVKNLLLNKKYVLFLLLEAIDNFPSDDFRTVDQLWEKYSNGKFGFRVQKQIYKQIFVNSEQTQRGNQEIWNKFGEEVGWRKGDNWLSYDEPEFELQNMRKGELPRLWTPGQKIGIKNFHIEDEDDNLLCKFIFRKKF
ncbi:P-loop NTPase fold protein [Okeania sp. SIO1I7]|uniref:P-loop NTPase fold protein n=1 Tax=Okeania sp. SIO1I7 TaxID=2607772 RepID=UPI0013FA2429|nr:P-loop NTPase fold protein [Okeania sp. SIO1I7]NET29154.1 hypothetical protein [Okeania sp. SIO1I7]